MIINQLSYEPLKTIFYRPPKNPPAKNLFWYYKKNVSLIRTAL